MDRRTFITGLTATAALAGSASATAPARVMTVLGWLDADRMGITLSHEHLVADIRPLAARTAVTLDYAAIEAAVLPHLAEVRALGCRTLIDCTAVHLGRDPAMLKRLSQASGVNIVMTTGVYAAADAQFLPDYALREDAETLADRWIGEWRDGIDGTDVRPGLIKIGVNGGALSPVESKIIDAAAIAHLATGLPIGSHTGPWRAVDPGYNALSAHQQIDRLAAGGVSPQAFIWIHAQNEADTARHVDAAKRGAWISYDNVAPDTIDTYAGLMAAMKDQGLLEQVLISHDAGWYSIGEPAGGTFRPFTPVFTHLVPALITRGFDQADINTLLVHNPARAFRVGKKRA